MADFDQIEITGPDGVGTGGKRINTVRKLGDSILCF